MEFRNGDSGVDVVAGLDSRRLAKFVWASRILIPPHSGHALKEQSVYANDSDACGFVVLTLDIETSGMACEGEKRILSGPTCL